MMFIRSQPQFQCIKQFRHIEQGKARITKKGEKFTLRQLEDAIYIFLERGDVFPTDWPENIECTVVRHLSCKKGDGFLVAVKGERVLLERAEAIRQMVRGEVYPSDPRLFRL